MNTKKHTFSTIYILLIFLLISLPFITTFQDVLTNLVMQFGIYRSFQNFVVPYEMRVLTSLLNLFRLNTQAGPTYIQFLQNGREQVIYLAWNCIGWQSFILLLITFLTGLSGKYKNISKFEALLIGVLGTYLINILRLVLVVAVYYFTGLGIGVVFHDYFSNLLSIAWLFLFWWMSFKFILEPLHDPVS